MSEINERLVDIAIAANNAAKSAGRELEWLGPIQARPPSIALKGDGSAVVTLKIAIGKEDQNEGQERQTQPR